LARSCPLCLKRKGRRACPAKGETICPQCCGAKRLVEIDCPEDCVYLGGGAPGWSRETEKLRDARRLYGMTDGLSENQARLLFVGLLGLVALRARHLGLDDVLLGSALAALRKTTETRMNGIVYEHPTGDTRAQALLRDLAPVFEAREDSGRVALPADRDLLAVLRGLETAMNVETDASPTSFLDTVVRLVGRRTASPSATPGAEKTRLVL
jgi:hypothetical protein